MKRSQLLLGTALAGTVLFAAAPADAQFYARLDSGFAFGRDANFGDNQAQIDANTTLFIENETSSPGKLDEIGNSWLIDAGLGYRFNPWLRTDLTVGYRGGYELDDVAQDIMDASSAAQVNAEITSIPVLINAYIDLGGVVSNVGGIVPYIGAGVGFARNEIDDIRAVILDEGLTSQFIAPGGSNVDLAWAIMAGFSAPLPGVRNLFLDVGYRYLDSGQITTDGGPIQVTGTIETSQHAGFEGDLTAHEFKAGLRYVLGGAPARPAPVAAAPVYKTYIVYFAFDRSDLSPAAMAEIDRAVADYKENGVARLTLEGNTDRAGSDAYNETLSKARVDAVAARITAQGVTVDAIKSAWFGEKKPRVQTEDGVRNDENRRVDIVLQR